MRRPSIKAAIQSKKYHGARETCVIKQPKEKIREQDTFRASGSFTKAKCVIRQSGVSRRCSARIAET
jgi:hypothetical protein